MFTTKCFIRKNTPELREKLENMGYHICICCKFKDNIWLNNYINDELDRYEIHGLGEGSIEGSQEAAFNLFLHENAARKNPAIDCGDNEDLFLAVAALRDDTDYMQWFMIPKTKMIPIPGYCGQQGMNGYQRIITSVEYHKYDRKDSRISDMIKFEKEDGETILPRKLNIEELKLWFNHKIMHNPYEDDPNIKYYTNNIR